ncbi:hypothetical protein [Ruminococcus sp. Marseille-P6503]|uniref:hypothetical protein n=1 Tax=Ruminococcus sp. Marseille-P6503 TaxID=2364796 RepID=UPI000F53DF1E|nr:hypothetical protein [Ruminococcus sp. Marseille-P6503]
MPFEYINDVGQVDKAVTDRTIALDELKAAIAEAELISGENYTEDSYAELTTALTAAKELPEDSLKRQISKPLKQRLKRLLRAWLKRRTIPRQSLHQNQLLIQNQHQIPKARPIQTPIRHQKQTMNQAQISMIRQTTSRQRRIPQAPTVRREQQELPTTQEPAERPIPTPGQLRLRQQE